MNIENLNIGYTVLVISEEHGHEFEARIVDFAKDTDGTDLIVVVDQDDDAFHVTINEIVEIVETNDASEHDCFRNDVEADADTLASAGLGTDEDYI
jgi:hypothetical protein